MTKGANVICCPVLDWKRSGCRLRRAKEGPPTPATGPEGTSGQEEGQSFAAITVMSAPVSTNPLIVDPFTVNANVGLAADIRIAAATTGGSDGGAGTGSKEAMGVPLGSARDAGA